MDIGEVVQVTLRMSIPGASSVLNVWHYRLDAANIADEVVMPAIAARFEEALEEWWVPIASQACNIVDIAGRIVNPDGTIERDLGFEDIDLDGEATPDSNTAIISIGTVTPTGTPKTRGRKFVTGLSEAAIQGGLFEAGAVLAAASLVFDLQQMIEAGAGGRLNAVVRSVPLQTFVNLLPTVSAKTDPWTQRRRGRNRGS